MMAHRRMAVSMRGKSQWAALAAASISFVPAFAQDQASSPPRDEGSLYPASSEAVEGGPLGNALGPTRYILNDIGQSEEFRALVRKAVGIHPLFHKEISARAEARGHVAAERAALYPRLSANLNGDYVLARDFGASTDNVVESLRPEGQFNAGLSVSQLLFDGGASLQRIRGAKAHVRAEQLSISARVNELSLSALSAYHDLAAHQAILKFGDDFIRRHEKLLADVKERERLGAGTRADVMQASARLASARARVSQIRESMRLAEIRYEEFFKEEPTVLVRPSFEAAAVGSRDEAVGLSIAHNPEIAAAAARSDRATADYRAARARRLPELRANVGAVKYDVFDGGDDYDVRGTVNMNYDLYAGGARKASISQAGEAARQQKLDEAEVRRETERDAAIAFERREASTERLAALADALVSNYQARDLIAERFRVARGELIDILQAENDYFEAGVAYLIGLADRDMATYALMEHTGDLLRFFSPQPEYAEGGLIND